MKAIPHIKTDPSALDFALVIDDNAVATGASSFDANHVGHAAYLIGDDDQGWTYHSKNGIGNGAHRDVRRTHSSMNDFFADTGSRYKPWMPSVPNAILSNLDRRNVNSRMLSTPNWKPRIFNNKYLRWP